MGLVKELNYHTRSMINAALNNDFEGVEYIVSNI